MHGFGMLANIYPLLIELVGTTARASMKGLMCPSLSMVKTIIESGGQWTMRRILSHAKKLFENMMTAYRNGDKT